MAGKRSGSKSRDGFEGVFGKLPVGLGKYFVERFMARGGMGEVYYATEIDLKRPVVVKVLTPSTGDVDEQKRRFHKEALAAAKLFHPNVATIFEIGEARAISFITMEYVEGENIDKAFAKIDLSMEEIVEIFRQLADALRSCHEKQIFHRDIKPSNITLTPELVPKILDFGVARIETNSVTEKQTSEIQVVGTISYMSPEQARGEKVTGQADIFSLGVTFYELLTQEYPFGEKGKGIEYILERQRLNYLPLPPSHHNPNITPELSEIILRMLHFNSDQRYEDASKLQVDLNRIAEKMRFNKALSRRPKLEKVRAFVLLFLLPVIVSLIVFFILMLIPV